MSESKSRINMRVSEENLALIKSAAVENDQDMTSFVLGAALDKARSVLIEARVTRLTADEANRFEELLDREPREVPALRALLASAQSQAMRTKDRAGH